MDRDYGLAALRDVLRRLSKRGGGGDEEEEEYISRTKSASQIGIHQTSALLPAAEGFSTYLCSYLSCSA
jgi:hypothetical protein